LIYCLYLTAKSQKYMRDSPVMATDPEGLGFSTKRLARITSLYQKHVETGDLPGAVVAITRNVKLAYLEAIGFQDRGRTIPMRPDAIFWIASMTKPVTSVAAMTVIEDRKIELDAAVSRYLPELASMQVATKVADPTTGRTKLVLAQQKRPMTVRDLLRHTSGLVYPPQYINSTLHRLYGSAVFTRDTTLADFVASLGKLPLVHSRARSGNTVGALTCWRASSRSAQVSHLMNTCRLESLVRLLDPAPEGRPALRDVTKPARLFSGGGGLVSTAADYLRFCQMLLSLSPETVKLMTTNSLSPGVRFAQDMISPAASATWGVGFAIRTGAGSSVVRGSTGSFGWGGVWGTSFWVDPVES
jgi:CubicO group peptidase (beta-lactamase class C family)